MSDYEVGKGKPPKASQFKSGTSGNPKGRPKREPVPLSESINNAFETPIEYTKGGLTKNASAHGIFLRNLVDRAFDGNVDAAATLLNLRIQAERRGKRGAEIIEISDWLPDYPGQTAERKTRDYARKKHAAPEEWWSQSKLTPSKTED